MIETINLSKTFGNVTAVKNLNLKIGKGEFFAFIGPNAAGKTTTIKLITGLLKPIKGKVLINGYDNQKFYEKTKMVISYIPDFPYVYEKLTAMEFLQFIGRLYKIPEDKIITNSKKYLKKFDLSEYSHKLIQDFSHGMKQKLIFIAAFLHNPKVIIIDEPMVGLDPKSAKLVKNILKEKSQEGVSIFMSTHTLSVAEELADRIGVLDNGKLIACGTFQELTDISGSSGKLEEIFLKLTKEKSSTKKNKK